MELDLYFEPVSAALRELAASQPGGSLGLMPKHEPGSLPPLQGATLALVGVPEGRNCDDPGVSLAPDAVREKIYGLFAPFPSPKIVDLGNMVAGKRLADSYVALAEVVAHLLREGVLPIVLGGPQHLAYACYKGFERLEQVVNLTAIAPRLHLGHGQELMNEHSYLREIVADPANQLYDFCNIGLQRYYVSQEELDKAIDLKFELLRLGQAQANLEGAEPLLRDANLVSVDLASVRHSEAPGLKRPSANGFFGYEFCQLGRYAGLSDRVQCLGLFGLSPELDPSGRSAELCAQFVWHFAEGFQQRKRDYPIAPIEEAMQFNVFFEQEDTSLVFYKSKRSGRWWIEVPYLDQGLERKLRVACTKQDYDDALKGVIPDRWWRHFNKLS